MCVVKGHEGPCCREPSRWRSDRVADLCGVSRQSVRFHVRGGVVPSIPYTNMYVHVHVCTALVARRMWWTCIAICTASVLHLLLTFDHQVFTRLSYSRSLPVPTAPPTVPLPHSHAGDYDSLQPSSNPSTVSVSSSTVSSTLESSRNNDLCAY